MYVIRFKVGSFTADNYVAKDLAEAGELIKSLIDGCRAEGLENHWECVIFPTEK